MALRFFYRRQKLVFIIMAVLMVSFLIGYQGFRMVFERGRGRHVIGRTRNGKIYNVDLLGAQEDLRLLRMMSTTGAETGRPALRIPPEQYQAMLPLFMVDRGEAALAYALLIDEAEAAGVRVTDVDVDDLLAGRAAQDQKQTLLEEMQAADVDEDRLRAAAGRWLMVYKNHLAGRVNTPPSRRELAHAYRNFGERIRLRVAVVRARDFRFALTAADRAATTQPAAVRKQFEKYRGVDPGTFAEDEPMAEAFGFGYRRPTDRVNVLYTVIDRDAVEEAVGLTPQASGEERAALRRVASARTDVIAREAGKVLAEYAEMEEPPEDVLAFYRSKGLVADADELIAAELPVVNIDELPLREALERLVDRAGPRLKRVILPPEFRLLHGDRKVTLVTTRVTLAEALRRLVRAAVEAAAEAEAPPEAPTTQPATTRPATTQPAAARPTTRPAPEPVKVPKWQWVRFKGLEGALFAAGGDAGMGSLPLGPPEETGLVDRDGLRTRPVVGWARTSAGQPLESIVFGPEEPGAAEEPLVRVGEAGERLESAGGTVVWRLIEAVPAGEPEQITPEVRERIARDLTTVKLFRLAWDHAEELKARAEAGDTGLAAAADGDEAVSKVYRTDMISRRTTVRVPGPMGWQTAATTAYVYDPAALEVEPWQRRQIEAQSRTPAEAAERLEMARQLKLFELLREVPERHRREMMAAAFELAPEDIAPPYPPTPVRVKRVGAASSGEVLLMERIGYEPPARDEFEAQRGQLAARLQQAAGQLSSVLWFRLDEVKKRTGFVEEAP
jgi:hypothetical protein